MAHHDLLAAVRARTLARGMTLADLARAGGMTPGNLRRLLSEGAATPRLGTVMRLLPPLDAAIGPMGARTSAELVGYLDAERRRLGWSWEEMAGGEALGPTMLRRVDEAPETLPLDLVKRFADALAIELDLVDAKRPSEPSARGERSARSRSVSDAGREGASQRFRASAGQGGGDAAAAVDRGGSASSAGASSPSAASRAFRPPRIGRYREGAPGQAERGASEGNQEARSAGAAEARASDEAVKEQEILRARPRSITASLRAGAHDVSSSLAGISAEEWQALYMLYVMARRREVPRPESTEAFARGVQEIVTHIQKRTAPTMPPFVPGRARASFDPAVVWELWSRSRASERMPPREGKWVTVLHRTLDDQHVLTVRSPGGRDFVARLIGVGPAAEMDFEKHHCFEPSIPFRVRLAGRPLAFSHVRVGPICGVIDLSLPGQGEHTMLLVGVGWSLAILECRGEERRVVWHGAAEELRELDLGELWQGRGAGVSSRSGEAAASDEVAALHEARARDNALHQAERAAWASERAHLEERIQAQMEDPAVVVEVQAAAGRLSGEFRERLAQVNDGFAQVQALSAERERLLAELGAAQETIASLRATCEKAVATDEVAALRDAIESLRGQREAALAERDASRGECSGVRDELAGSREEVAALRTALEGLGEHVAAIEGDRRALAAALEGERTAVFMLTTELGEARERLGTAFAEKAEAEAALGACQQEVVELRKMVASTEELEARAKALRSQLEEIEQAMSAGRVAPAKRQPPATGSSQARKFSEMLHKKKGR